MTTSSPPPTIQTSHHVGLLCERVQISSEASSSHPQNNVNKINGGISTKGALRCHRPSVMFLHYNGNK